LLDECFGFLLRGFELLDVAVELADVLSDEGVAFALLGRALVYCVETGLNGLGYLLLWRGLPQETSDGLHGGRSM
jgi:hypothetical protein